jgi:hypothetical protein
VRPYAGNIKEHGDSVCHNVTDPTTGSTAMATSVGSHREDTVRTWVDGTLNIVCCHAVCNEMPLNRPIGIPDRLTG